MKGETRFAGKRHATETKVRVANVMRELGIVPPSTAGKPPWNKGLKGAYRQKPRSFERRPTGTPHSGKRGNGPGFRYVRAPGRVVPEEGKTTEQLKAERDEKEHWEKKYTKANVDLICDNLKLGLIRDDCYRGIVSRKAFLNWLRDKPEFAEAVEQAELACKKRAITVVQQAMVGNKANGIKADAKYACWWLERKHKAEFGTKEDEPDKDKLKVVSVSL